MIRKAGRHFLSLKKIKSSSSFIVCFNNGNKSRIIPEIENFMKIQTSLFHINSASFEQNQTTTSSINNNDNNNNNDTVTTQFKAKLNFLTKEILSVIPKNARAINYETNEQAKNKCFILAQHFKQLLKQTEQSSSLSTILTENIKRNVFELNPNTCLDLLISLYYYQQFGGSLTNRKHYDSIFSSMDHAIKEQPLNPLLCHMRAIFLQKYARDICLPLFRQDDALDSFKQAINYLDKALKIYEEKIKSNDGSLNEVETKRYYSIHCDKAMLHLFLSNMYKAQAFYVKPEVMDKTLHKDDADSKLASLMEKGFTEDAIKKQYEELSQLESPEQAKKPLVIPEKEKAYLEHGETALKHFRKAFEYELDAKAVYAYSGALFLMENVDEAIKGYKLLFENDRKLYKELGAPNLQKETTINYTLSLYHRNNLDEIKKVLTDTLMEYPNEAPLKAFLLHVNVQSNPESITMETLEEMKRYFHEIEQLEREILRGDIQQASYDPRQLHFFKGLCYAYLAQINSAQQQGPKATGF
ncbi:hypothetical protein ABK040_002392 [Willaertia magna]